METLDSKYWCDKGTTVKRNYRVKDDTTIKKKKKQGSEKKVFSEYEYKKEGRKGTHGRTEKYRVLNHKERVTKERKRSAAWRDDVSGRKVGADQRSCLFGLEGRRDGPRGLKGVVENKKL